MHAICRLNSVNEKISEGVNQKLEIWRNTKGVRALG